MRVAGISSRARKLERRIALLEQDRQSQSAWPLLVYGAPLPEASVVPDQRVVEDWYRDLAGIVLARPRITSELNDLGRRCEQGGCLIDVVRELHANCPNRQRGSCTTCSGLDLEAESEPTRSIIQPNSTPTITFKHPQWIVFNCDARFRVLVAGRRFGKTFLALTELARAARQPGRLAWYVAPSYRQAKRIAWKPLKQLTRPLWSGKPNESELKIELITGGTICLRGADNYDSLRGDGLDFVVLDEFASMSPEAWTEVLRPALSDRLGRALFIGTPQGYNHFHDLYTAAQGQSDWAAFQYSTEEGGNVSAEELAHAAAQLDMRIYQQEFCASFENLTSGRAYYAFDRSQDVGPVKFDPRHPLIWALDFNVDPGCSVLAQVITSEVWDPAVRSTLRFPDSRIHVLEEIVIRNSNTYEICKEFARRIQTGTKYRAAGHPKLRVEVYGDAAGEARNASAPRTSWQIVKDFFAEHSSDFSVSYRYSTRNPFVRDRMNCVNAMLCDARDRRSITISPDCKELIRDLEQVCWAKDANGNDTGDLDKSNLMRTHTSDALGYLIAQRFPMPASSTWPTTRPII